MCQVSSTSRSWSQKRLMDDYKSIKVKYAVAWLPSILDRMSARTHLLEVGVLDIPWSRLSVNFCWCEVRAILSQMKVEPSNRRWSDSRSMWQSYCLSKLLMGRNHSPRWTCSCPKSLITKGWSACHHKAHCLFPGCTWLGQTSWRLKSPAVDGRSMSPGSDPLDRYTLWRACWLEGRFYIDSVAWVSLSWIVGKWSIP